MTTVLVLCVSMGWTGVQQAAAEICTVDAVPAATASRGTVEILWPGGVQGRTSVAPSDHAGRSGSYQFDDFQSFRTLGVTDAQAAPGRPGLLLPPTASLVAPKSAGGGSDVRDTTFIGISERFDVVARSRLTRPGGHSVERPRVEQNAR